MRMMILLFVGLLAAPNVFGSTFYEQCVLEHVASGEAELTVAEIRKQCAIEPDSLGEARANRELSLFGDEFSILLHRDNYILPVAHNNEARDLPEGFGEARELDDEEIKFQISIKSMLLNNLPYNARLFAAYTNQSHWQAYNSDYSRPFRETNHQPEVLLEFPLEKKYRGITFDAFRFALNHQSNGRSGLVSRSWNRAYAELLMSTKYSKLGLRSWWQITDDEDNPDIADYLGHFQLDGLRQFGKHQLHWKLRDTLDSNDRGALELGWSRRIGGREDIRLYLQYFNGYGESLIDYNRKTERIGLGFKIGVE